MKLLISRHCCWEPVCGIICALYDCVSCNRCVRCVHVVYSCLLKALAETPRYATAFNLYNMQMFIYTCLRHYKRLPMGSYSKLNSEQTKGTFHFAYILVNFPKRSPIGESLLPFWSVLHFVKWTREDYMDRPLTPWIFLTDWVSLFHV